MTDNNLKNSNLKNVVNISNLNYSNFSNTSEQISFLRKKYFVSGTGKSLNSMSYKSDITNGKMLSKIIELLEIIKAKSSDNIQSMVRTISNRLPYLRLVSKEGDLYLKDPALYENPDLVEELIQQIIVDVETYKYLRTQEKQEYKNFMGKINERLPAVPVAPTPVRPTQAMINERYKEAQKRFQEQKARQLASTGCAACAVMGGKRRTRRSHKGRRSTRNKK